MTMIFSAHQFITSHLCFTGRQEQAAAQANGGRDNGGDDYEAVRKYMYNQT